MPRFDDNRFIEQGASFASTQPIWQDGVDISNIQGNVVARENVFASSSRVEGPAPAPVETITGKFKQGSSASGLAGKITGGVLGPLNTPGLVRHFTIG